MPFIDEAMKSVDELNDSISKCDFKSVKLVAIATKFSRDALDNNEITRDTYNILINRIGMITSTAPGKCSCTKI